MAKNCCHTSKKHKSDYLLFGSLLTITVSILLYYINPQLSFYTSTFQSFNQAITELMIKMSWGLAIGILFVGLLDKIPKEFITALMGKNGTINGVIRAAFAGILLDLCSHGILLVAMKLYKRGLSLGQTMAFLIASPWNSFSLTLILWSLIGLKWTLAFLILSMLIAITSGIIFNWLVEKNILDKNPNSHELPSNFSYKESLKNIFKDNLFKLETIWKLPLAGLKESKMILRWILFGVILAAIIRTFVPADAFQTLFGPTIIGLSLTIVVATILEICSEGSTPIAADILTRASAPGNAFTFLMTGVSTDYTEILALKETTKSWKTALFLPLVTVPQVIILAFILNKL